MAVKNSDQRVLALREVIAAKTKELGNPPAAKYKTNLSIGGKNVLALTLNEIRSNMANLLVLKAANTDVNLLLGHVETFDQQDLLDDLVVRGKILLHKTKEAELKKLQDKLDALRSEDLRISDELDNLEELFKN